MFRRLLSFILIVCLLCTQGSAVLAEVVADVSKDNFITLRRGDKDKDGSTDVANLQSALIELDYLFERADGIYGSNTEKAVKYFQRYHGLKESGVADADTQNMLFNGTNLINFSQTGDPYSISARLDKYLNMWGFTGNIFNGENNKTTEDMVPAFKRYLREGYYTHHPLPTPEPMATIAPDQITGFDDAEIPVDTRIVKEDPDAVTPEIMDFLDRVYEFEVYTQTVSNGDENAEVLRVQRRLYNLKYLTVANGVFDSVTERALLYFQKRNGLPQTGVADEVTQRLLFSEAAVKSNEYVSGYKFIVDESEQRVYAYQWNGSDYNTCVRTMICSTGEAATPTPKNTYHAVGPTGTGEWYWFEDYRCYAKWATRIVGAILFHSVTYTPNKHLIKGSVSKLGRRASHGCIRLSVEDAEWIYHHCDPGAVVIIQD